MLDDINTQPPQTGGMPIVGRPIINANIGVTNRVEADDIKSIMMNTFDDIASVLSDHCGPYGQFAMIVNPSNKVAEPVFTKDGIGIVRAMEYMSPMQEFVRTTLAYIGSRVETAAGDGTTSSMIICATGLKHLLKFLSTTTYAYSYNHMMSIYRHFADSITTLLEGSGQYNIDRLCDNKTEEERKKIIYRVAYSQAYTSSHGNKKLSDAVAKLFSETPKEAWNYLYIDKCKYESDDLYTVAIDESQYTVNNTHPYPSGKLTEDMGTARHRKQARIVLSGICPTKDDSYMEGHLLYEDIEKSISDVSHPSVAYICPRDIDTNTMNHLNDLFKKHPNNDVVMFFVEAPDPRLNDIVCMKTLNNNFSLVSEFVGDYSYCGGDLKIESGLYENPTGSKLNPMVGNIDYPNLNLMLENIDKIIKQIKSQVANRTLNSDIANLQKLRLKLMVSRRTYFLIGGSAYDNAAAVDVVVDAILAVKHTLTKGFGLAGNKTLYKILTTKEMCINDSDSSNVLFKEYCRAFSDGILAVFQAASKWHHENIVFNPDASVDLARFTGKSVTVDSLTENLDSDKFDVPIIQPISADIELIRRFGELSLKFVRTARIIAPGGLVSKEEIKTV